MIPTLSRSIPIPLTTIAVLATASLVPVVVVVEIVDQMTMPRIPPMIALRLCSLLPMDPFRNTGALKSLEDQQPPRIVQVLHRSRAFLCVVLFHGP